MWTRWLFGRLVWITYLAIVLVSVELDVINPNILGGRSLDSDGVDRGLAFSDLQVANDDVLSLEHTKSDANKT